MMTKEELEGYTTYKDKYQMEKDYLQDLLLSSVYSNTTDEFVFKGGTAISKFYNSDRFSEDLDFTSRRIDAAGARKLIDSALKSIQYTARYVDEPAVNTFGTIEAAIDIEGPRYNGKRSTLQRIIFEINTTAVLIEKAVPMPRTPVYADARNYVALVMDKQEILSEKFRALMSAGRKHKERDLYDIYYLIGKGTSISKGLVLRKLKESKIDFSGKWLGECIDKVQATWTTLQPFVQHTLEGYEYVSGTVISAVKRDGLL